MTANSQEKMAETPEGRGLECPRCGCRHFYVIYTRPTRDGLRRRRECRHCGRMVTTIEKLKDGGSATKRPA